MKLKYLVLAAATTLALAACQPSNKPADAAAAPAATEAAPAAAPGDAAAAPAATAGTGVAECDQYLEKVYACIADKVPAEQRDMMKQAIDQSKSQWSSITDKSALAAQCKAASDAAKQSYGAMGCSF